MPVLTLYAIATGQAGQDRGQIKFYSLDRLIEAGNELQAIEALVFWCYNFSRTVSILGVKELISKAQGLFLAFLAAWGTVAGHVSAEIGVCCGDGWRPRAALAGVGRNL